MATYQAFTAPIADTVARWQLWGQFWGAGFTTIGWVAQTGHGEVTATGTGASYTWTGIPATAPTTALVPQVNYNFRGAFVPSTTYTGSNTANAANVDVVTSAGITYAHITATSSLATLPASDTTNWQPLIFEIWKSNGPNTASLPLYIKLVYSVGGTGSPSVRLMLSVGTGVDVNGNLTGAMGLTNAAPISVKAMDNGTTSTLTTAENDFAGNADNVRWCSQRGAGAGGYFSFFVLDRAKTASGTDSNGYAYLGLVGSAGGALSEVSGIFLNPTLGGIIMNNSGGGGWVGLVSNFTFTSSANFGSFPPYPIFPITGFLNNPVLGAMGFSGGDVTDGAVTTIWIYGQPHNYLMCSTFRATATANINNLSNGICPALQWE